MPSTQDARRWRLLDADEAERARFASLAETLAHAEAEPCAPPNTLRQVHRVVVDDRRYWLKRFRRVQVKNLARNVLTRPRSGVDAEREAAVAGALRAAGVRAPRPVAVGRSGLGSELLVAELPGEALRDRLSAGRCPRQLADRVADFCGGLFRRGFSLPDLSADHVFVDGADPATAEFGVLDLHDGSLGRPRLRPLRRCLRRFARSVRGLSIPRVAALRFATRLARAAGVDARRLIAGLPPFDTHGRYDAAGRAPRYAGRNPRRSEAELDLLRALWPGRPGELVLDAPCGAGRLAAPLHALAAVWHGADRSAAMLAEARRHDGEAAPLVRADARHLPFADRAFDGVVVFRFVHHLPAAQAREAIAEACRVAERFVVVSFFHPISLHNLNRRLGEAIARRPPARFTLRVADVDRTMRRAGFERVAVAAQARFVRDLWIAAYTRA